MPAERGRGAFHVIFAVLIASLIALGGRLLAFQRERHEDMARRAAGQQRMRITIPARRGNIYARSAARSELLAVSHQVSSCFADPKIIPPDRFVEVAHAAADALGLDRAELLAELDARRRSRFVWVKRELSEAELERLKELDLPGVAVMPEWRRRYPCGSLAAHVIGFTGFTDESGRERVGVAGVEAAAERYLRGVDGANEMLADAARRPVWNKPGAYTRPIDGLHVHLTIDVVIQRALERALAETTAKFRAESAVGVVVDPANGEILAMANVPTFDLSAPREGGEAGASRRRNRAVTDMYEPGSIFKPFIAASALAGGQVRWGEPIDCHNGSYRVRRGRVLHDAHPYGKLPVEAVVYKSSNIGMALLGLRMGNARLFETVRAFGFGRPTGVILPGEVGGQVNPLSTWKRDSTFSIPMGQEVAVTAVQVTMAFAALANDGVLLKPKLIRRVIAPDDPAMLDAAGPIVVGQVLPAEVCRRFVVDALGRVPTDGTGRRHARLDGWTSFGKTGTAQIAPYSEGQFTASYIAGAPLHAPRLVCLVSVRKPDRSVGHYGGEVAGPAVKTVLEQALEYMNVPKDAPEP